MAGSAYSSASSLNLDATRIIELTDNATAVNQPDQAILDETSNDAQDIIDDRLRGTYVVPFPPDAVPSAIKRLHLKLWRRLLYEHRPDMPVPPSIEADYQKALADLDDYATPGEGGRMLEGVPRRSGAGASPAAGSFSSDPDSNEPVRRVFGRYKDRLG